MKRLAVLSMIFMLTFTIIANTSPVRNDDPSMVGGTPAQERFSELDEVQILLIKDVTSFWGNSNEEIFDSLGYEYDVINSSTIPSIDFSAYTFILLEGNQPATFNQTVIDNMPQFEDFVNDGGWLEAHLATNSLEPLITLWDGTTNAFDGGIHNDLSNWMGPDGAGHPVLDGIIQPYGGNATNSGVVADFPADGDVIVVNDNGIPTYVEYQHGAGNVIATTLTMEFLWTNDYSGGQILYNSLIYCVENTSSAVLFLTPVSTVVPMSGGSVVYDAQMINRTGFSFPSLRYMSWVTLPNGQRYPSSAYQFIDFIPFALEPFMNTTVTGMTLDVPALAPQGPYIFHGAAGFPANPDLQVHDSFSFVKVGAGFFEDFPGDPGDLWEWDMGDEGSTYFDNETSVVFNMLAETDEWGSGVYTGDFFADFTASTTFTKAATEGNSAGILFRCDGPFTDAMDGYGVYCSAGSWGAWRYLNGASTRLVSWTEDPAINQGPGSTNTIQIDANGDTFDVMFNGIYVGSFTDEFPIASGFVGIASARGNVVAFDNLSASQPVPARTGGYCEIGRVETDDARDDAGIVIAAPDELSSPLPPLNRSAEFIADEIDIKFVGTTHLCEDDNSSLAEIPSEFKMAAAFPNPFNASTSIAVSLPHASELTVNVYNVMGQRVAELANGQYNAGQSWFTFDASELSSGMYFVHVQVARELNSIQKIALMK